MKKFMIIAVSLISLTASAQSFKLNGYANYVFDDQVDSYWDNESYFDGTIKGGLLWGVGAQYNFKPNYGLELTYYSQSTSARAHYQIPGSAVVTDGNFDVNLNWVMLNGVREMRKPGSNVEVFGGLGLGACFINTENKKTGNSKSSTNFAWQLRAGTNIWVSEKVAIKLNAQLLSAVQSVGGGFYIGTGGGGAGVSSYSSLLQLALGGGIVFKLSDAWATPTTTTPPEAAPQKF